MFCPPVKAHTAVGALGSRLSSQGLTATSPPSALTGAFVMGDLLQKGGDPTVGVCVCEGAQHQELFGSFAL